MRDNESTWVSSWSASPQPIWEPDFEFPIKIPITVRATTIRQIVRISLGGSRVRVIFSNAYGNRPLRIGAATVALAANGPTVAPSTIHKLTFGGENGIVVPPGAPAISDPVDMAVEDHARLAVSLYLPDETPLTTFHWDGRQTSYFADGDVTHSVELTDADTTDTRILLSEVLVDTPNNGVVVVLGDSITDGACASLDADTRWPDFLARRLAPHRVAVLNAGISGARLLGDKMGTNAAARLDRDAFAHPNVRAVIILIGTNDIGWPGTTLARAEMPPATEALIAAYRQFCALAHARNVRIIGGTLPPFEGALPGTPLDNYYDAAKDAQRQKVNRWIRDSDTFDAIVDFDALLRDPSHPTRLTPAFDSGDHLHPGDEGNRAMADAIDIDALLGRRPHPVQ